MTIDPEFLPQGPYGGRSRRWLGVAAVAILVIVIGWLLRSTPPGRQVGQATDASTVEPFAATASAGGPSPIASSPPLYRAASSAPLRDAIPGFVDTITTLNWGNHGLDIWRWRASEAAPETVMSLAHDDGGWNRSVDASGRWLTEIRGDSGLTVHALDDARAATLHPSELTLPMREWSAVWHDTRPGQLAWLACSPQAPGSPIMLYTADVTARTVEAVAQPLTDHACEAGGVWLARWGDWGMLLTAGSGTGQVLLNAEGMEVAQGILGPEGEWLVGAGPAGTTIWTEGLGRSGASSFVLSPDGLDRRPVPGLADGERLESALGSPDGSLLALVPDLVANFGSNVRIVEADTGSVVAEIPEPSWWVTRLVWSSDSRFLIYERWPDVTSNWTGVPQDVELVFYDTEAHAGVALPLPGYAPALRSAR